MQDQISTVTEEAPTNSASTVSPQGDCGAISAQESSANITEYPEIDSATNIVDGQDDGQVDVIIDQNKKERLTDLFLEVIENQRFWAKENRVKKLEEALKLPLFDKRALQQFAISARDELTKEAMELAIKSQTVPVMPTEEQIKKRAEEKYEAKVERERKKKDKRMDDKQVINKQ